MTKRAHPYQGKSQMTTKQPDIQVEEVVIISEPRQDPEIKRMEQEAAAVLGAPGNYQQQTLGELTALYYALLGPQFLLQASSTVSRPPYPVPPRRTLR